VLQTARRYLEALEAVTRRDHLRSQDENLASVPTAFAEALRQLEDSERFVFVAAGGVVAEVEAALTADWNLVHVHDRDGHTALHAASAMDNIDVVRLLLEKGASVSVQDFEGNTPMHLAVDAGAIASVRVLLEAGGDPVLRNNVDQTPVDLVDSLPARNRDTMRDILTAAIRPKGTEKRA
jgi:hypothetical protein